MARNFLVLCAILCGIAIATLLLAGRDDSRARETVPDFAFTTLDGEKTTLHAQRSDIVLIHFWATWCAPCLIEFPDLVARVAAEEGVALLAVSVDRDKAALEKFLKALPENPRIRHVFDPEKELTAQFSVRLFPETLVLGRDFRLLQHIKGPADWTRYRFTPVK